MCVSDFAFRPSGRADSDRFAWYVQIGSHPTTRHLITGIAAGPSYGSSLPGLRSTSAPPWRNRRAPCPLSLRVNQMTIREQARSCLNQKECGCSYGEFHKCARELLRELLRFFYLPLFILIGLEHGVSFNVCLTTPKSTCAVYPSCPVFPESVVFPTVVAVFPAPVVSPTVNDRTTPKTPMTTLGRGSYTTPLQPVLLRKGPDRHRGAPDGRWQNAVSQGFTL